MSERVNPLADLSDFSTTPNKPKPDPQAIETLANEAGFPSRQPQPAQPIAQQSAAQTAPQPSSEHVAPRKQRRYTTGRNVQIPIKGTAETRAELEALSDELQAPYGEILARALAALRREMKKK